MLKHTLQTAMVAALIVLLSGAANARESKLGKVDFPTSGSPKAQTHFLRAVAALHSFWYPVALEEFRASTKIDPAFMMGYWGEAMAYNHTLWGDEQDTAAAREVIARIKDTPQLTPRERAYLHAVKVLYGEGDKPTRDKAYAAAMEKIHHEYPKDLEAASFYALALLGTARPGDPTALRTRMQAAAIAQEVYHKEPNHPGAAHYIIHAFDDPNHAILALYAARRYARIAPAAPHALHMPSHIFLQLGMWREAAASNEAAWAASNNWVQSNGLPAGRLDYHSLHWLLYVYLQQGRYKDAEGLMATMRRSVAEIPGDDASALRRGEDTLATMAATLAMETEQWDAAQRELSCPGESTAGGEATASSNPRDSTSAPVIFACAMASAMNGSKDSPERTEELRAALRQQGDFNGSSTAKSNRVLEIQELEIAATASASRGNFDEAIRTMEKAIELEAALPPPSGPPFLIKPAHELFGEILLRGNRPDEAARQFATSLFRHPNRARSLLGAARTAVRMGDAESANDYYSRFLAQWKSADARLPEMQEAHNYINGAVPR